MQIKDNTFNFNVRITNIKTRIVALIGLLIIGTFFNFMWVDVFHPGIEKIILETEYTRSFILHYMWIPIGVYVFLGSLLTLFVLFLKGKLKLLKKTDSFWGSLRGSLLDLFWGSLGGSLLLELNLFWGSLRGSLGGSLGGSLEGSLLSKK
jgi:hypothetical protein